MDQESSLVDIEDLPEHSVDPQFFSFTHTHEQRQAVLHILKDFPARVTPYLQQLMKHSDAVKRQYIPHPDELTSAGTATPFEEGKHSTIVYGLEQVYRDRVLLSPHFDCPAYCRFCYKKARVLRGSRSMSLQDIDKATQEIAKLPTVRGVLITGGEPFMDLNKLFYMLDQVMALENVHEVRIGTRRLSNSPTVFTDALCIRLASYLRPCFEDPSKSKYLALNVHFNHPDELTPQAIEACHRLTSRGLTLRNQCVLLKGVNDSKQVIGRLFALLLRNNIIPYYLNHCLPVEGADHFRCSVARGQAIYKHLCTESSCAVPNFVFASEAGKYHVGMNEVFDYQELDGVRYIRVTLPYKAAEFRQITKHNLPPRHHEDHHGYIIGLYPDGSDD